MLNQPRSLAPDADCPCGGGVFGECCGPLLDLNALPATAEACMRSRYTAFALDNIDHLFRTWHPRTRPHPLQADPLTWTHLEVVRTVAGGADAETGMVEFVASWRAPDGTTGRLHETSSFARRAGRWVYVSGRVDPQ